MKYNNDEERKAARKKGNRESQQRSRARKKAANNVTVKGDALIKKALVKVTNPMDFVAKYVRDLRTAWAKYPFNYSLTVTNKALVTGNMQEKAVKDLLKGLVACDYITNYLKVHESYGENYHSHILFQSPLPMDILEEYFRKEWGSGFFRLKYMSTNEHRLNAVNYCFKQLEMNPNSDATQFLIDTWEISLVETFDDLKMAKMALLKDYKAGKGLNIPIDYLVYSNKSFVTNSAPKL